MLIRFEVPAKSYNLLLEGKGYPEVKDGLAEQVFDFGSVNRSVAHMSHGQLFEFFCCAVSSDRKEIPRVIPFHSAVRQSVKMSKRECLDENGLRDKRCYVNVLFKEIKNLLPKEVQNKLRMFCVIDSQLDLHGIDVLFVLDKHFAGVDLTLAPFENSNRWLVFSHFDLPPGKTKEFAERVSEDLLSGNNVLPNDLRDLVYKSE